MVSPESNKSCVILKFKTALNMHVQLCYTSNKMADTGISENKTLKVYAI